MLYIVSTPIGNMGDVSTRMRETLAKADYILVEDTRRAGNLFKLLDLPRVEFISYFEHNEEKRIPYILELLGEGKEICLISDGGTPLISDPGYRLIKACYKAGLAYTAVPGPCAVTNALVLSGFPTDSFIFMGFLPQKTSKRKEKLQTVAAVNTTTIFYESPFKIVKLLKTLLKDFADNEVCIIREMTKVYEEVIHGTVSELYERFKDKKFKGEITLVLSKKINK